LKEWTMLLRVDEDGLVFNATFQCGVPCVTEQVADEAERLLKLVGREVGEVEGNFSWTKFYVTTHFTEDEAELLEKAAKP